MQRVFALAALVGTTLVPLACAKGPGEPCSAHEECSEGLVCTNRTAGYLLPPETRACVEVRKAVDDLGRDAARWALFAEGAEQGADTTRRVIDAERALTPPDHERIRLLEEQLAETEREAAEHRRREASLREEQAALEAAAARPR